jgi:2-oxoglutarate dehydrogenase E1 component
LKEVGAKISHLPEDMNFHRLVRKIFEARAKSIADGKNIDWGTAEALAFATLIQDGYHVILSG